VAHWLYSNWQFLVEIIAPLGVVGMLLKLWLSKPKVVFCEARLSAGYEEGQSICWYILVINLRRDCWIRHFYQRENAVDCRVKIKFTSPDGKLTYNNTLSQKVRFL